MRGHLLALALTASLAANAEDCKEESTDPRSPITLRVIHVTDVYMLENFASLATLIKEQRASADDEPRALGWWCANL